MAHVHSLHPVFTLQLKVVGTYSAVLMLRCICNHGRLPQLRPFRPWAVSEKLHVLGVRRARGVGQLRYGHHTTMLLIPARLDASLSGALLEFVA